MTDIVDKNEPHPNSLEGRMAAAGVMKEAKEHIEWQRDEIERLRRVNDLLRAETSNPRYWEARYRDEVAKVDELQAALRSVIEAWDNEYAGEMAVDKAIEEAQKLLPQTGDEG